ncbi:MAG: SipW-dependent-type signal peptide-containing protein [Oscillospiraceae bacterium]|jgi:predicted ribosomally synthesized peptide with SipW-like signal peptide|nr:SipW-dependent-type signal peptide-containing protein [Oscillospiraceae bacterium]
MKKKENTKNSLLLSGLALLLSLSLFAGITFAWFTATVTSKGNVIKAGDLSIRVLGYDAEGQPIGGTDGATNDFAISALPLIEEAEFEPGLWNTKYVKIQNTGSLDLQFSLAVSFTVENGPSLQDILQYQLELTPAEVELPAASLLVPEVDDELWKSFEDLETDYLETGYQELPVGDTLIYRFDYKMCPFTGNTYQSMAIKADLTVAAVQALADDDSIVFIRSEENLREAIADGAAGQTFIFLNDITLSDNLLINKPFNFDLNKHMIYAGAYEIKVDIDESCAMEIANGAVRAKSLAQLAFDAPNAVINLPSNLSFCLSDTTAGSLGISGTTVVHNNAQIAVNVPEKNIVGSAEELTELINSEDTSLRSQNVYLTDDITVSEALVPTRAGGIAGIYGNGVTLTSTSEDAAKAVIEVTTNVTKQFVIAGVNIVNPKGPGILYAPHRYAGNEPYSLIISNVSIVSPNPLYFGGTDTLFNATIRDSTFTGYTLMRVSSRHATYNIQNCDFIGTSGTPYAVGNDTKLSFAWLLLDGDWRNGLNADDNKLHFEGCRFKAADEKQIAVSTVRHSEENIVRFDGCTIENTVPERFWYSNSSDNNQVSVNGTAQSVTITSLG